MRRRLYRSGIAIVILAAFLAGLSWYDLMRVRPAISKRLAVWDQTLNHPDQRAAALFSYGDFGALDLDTLDTSAVPWSLLAASLAMQEAENSSNPASWRGVEAAFRRFGFLYPAQLAPLSGEVPKSRVPLGISVGIVERTIPPIRIETISVGCSACHAGVAYRADGTADINRAVAAMPNTSLDLEAFTSTSYSAMKMALDDEAGLSDVIDLLFPGMGIREKLTLRFVAIPMARAKIRERQASFNRALPFFNGAPGLTNGVAALKHQLKVTPSGEFQSEAGFVSIPVLADRFFRSALLADGAYAPKGTERFRPVDRDEAKRVDPKVFAEIASFFMVPSMGLSDSRAAGAIPDLTPVMEFLRDWRPPRFPGEIDLDLAERGRDIYADRCAACHGLYDSSLVQPQLKAFPNWAGDVGTDSTRAAVFSDALADAVRRTLHGKEYIDVASTRVIAAPPLSGLWASAPYFVNGSVPTVRHILEPDTRPVRFMTGGHALDLSRLGIAGRLTTEGTWAFPENYKPFSRPVTIDTAKRGFSNRGHTMEVEGLSLPERDAVIEYLKLL